MHVLKIHDVKIDYTALALAMGNGNLSVLFFTVAMHSHIELRALNGIYRFIFAKPGYPILRISVVSIITFAVTIAMLSHQKHPSNRTTSSFLPVQLIPFTTDLSHITAY